MDMLKEKIGFVGLGLMGNAMARNLVQAGFETTVYDINPEAVQRLVDAGAVAARNLVELGRNCTIFITSLPGSPQVEEVILGENGLAKAAATGSLFIDMSSSLPSSTRAIAGELDKAGMMMVDAPVSGGPAKAATGQLSIMVGGEDKAVERAYPILEVLGKEIIHVGAISAGHTMKAVNNLVFGVTLAGVAEAFVLGVKAGLSVEKMVEVISCSSGRCYTVDTKIPNIVMPRHFRPGFTTNLLHKDLENAITLGKQFGLPMPVSNVVQQMYAFSQAKGYGDLDNTALIRIYEEVMGVEVK
ncbi:MAG: 2-hydroxy-3-oxopropionate reductase [Bacillota bacterium]|jgi:3-hydroxyisobutyrate dehydrogenase|nr:2-hydroxy-3-oxopropionate reductase [Bacillota bacterium]